MRELNLAGYATDRLQADYDEARRAGESHGDAVATVAGKHGVEVFKVARLVLTPEGKRRVAEAQARRTE